MRFIESLSLLAPLALLLATPALAQNSMPMQGDMPGMSGAKPGPANAAMMAGMAKMQYDMGHAPVTGDADKDFVAMMIPHHQGAVDMARAELRYGKDAQIRKLAQMKEWQAKNAAK